MVHVLFLERSRIFFTFFTLRRTCTTSTEPQISSTVTVFALSNPMYITNSPIQLTPSPLLPLPTFFNHWPLRKCPSNATVLSDSPYFCCPRDLQFSSTPELVFLPVAVFLSLAFFRLLPLSSPIMVTKPTRNHGSSSLSKITQSGNVPALAALLFSHNLPPPDMPKQTTNMTMTNDDDNDSG